MKRLLNSILPTPGKPVPLDEDEANHAIRVMRLVHSDKVWVMDGRGKEVEASLIVEGKKARLEFVRIMREDQENSLLPEVVLEMSILKGDAMSWVIEKAVELGANRLIPLETDHVVVRVKEKGPHAFQERWQRIADQALKQCGRLKSMHVAEPVSLETLFLNSSAMPGLQRFWLDEKLASSDPAKSLARSISQSSTSSIHLLIGPEGGWSEKERLMLSSDASFNTSSAHLGPWVLRAETACLAALTLARSLDKNTLRG